ncbi:MAG TPA: lipoate--protein ligase [Gemmatimonadaceae bacterium]|nr:lipoate--protein ligase [Gemmatimonadaceae bacterium]
MRFIDNRGITDAQLNLALEEWCLLNLDIDDSYLLFYVNAPSVIIGKHQNTVEEINADFIEERGITVVRRISGGGAVYHDLGNLNFSFITRYAPSRFNNYAEFNRPFIEALRSLGVPAEVSGRNDIVVEGRKVSGNAQVVRGERMFSHGTLLLHSNLDDVVLALRVKPGKIESKGIQSVRSRVANINEFLSAPVTVEELRRRLLDHVFPGGVAERPLSDAEWREVEALADRKYRTWDWNYGESPDFNLQRAKRFPIGEIDVRLEVTDGHIRAARLYGDFFARGDITELEGMLVGARYAREDIVEVLASAPLEKYLAEVGVEELAELIY